MKKARHKKSHATVFFRRTVAQDFLVSLLVLLDNVWSHFLNNFLWSYWSFKRLPGPGCWWIINYRCPGHRRIANYRCPGRRWVMALPGLKKCLVSKPPENHNCRRLGHQEIANCRCPCPGHRGNCELQVSQRTLGSRFLSVYCFFKLQTIDSSFKGTVSRIFFRPKLSKMRKNFCTLKKFVLTSICKLSIWNFYRL